VRQLAMAAAFAAVRSGLPSEAIVVGDQQPALRVTSPQALGDGEQVAGVHCASA